jgi:hypothetical protein
MATQWTNGRELRQTESVIAFLWSSGLKNLDATPQPTKSCLVSAHRTCFFCMGRYAPCHIHVDTGAAKCGNALELGALKWPFLALWLCGHVATRHSMLPLVCRFQPHNVRPKWVLGKQNIREAGLCTPKAR